MAIEVQFYQDMEDTVMVDNYELLLDVQRKSCYTCENFRKCNVLNDDVPCNYKPSKKAKKGIKGVNGFWNTIY